MKEVLLSAMTRSGTGKGPARRVRMAGGIPAVVYGPEIEPEPIAVNERDFRAVMKTATSSTIFTLDVNGKKNKVVLRDIQRDPVTSKVVHLDFHAVSMSKPINIFVPITFVGTPRGVKTDGGIMQTTMRELEISCLPSDIPEQVEVDVTDLGIGESIHVGDINIPNATIAAEKDRTVVVISAPTVVKAAATAAEEEAAEEAAAEEAAAAEVAASGEEGKKDEEKKE